MAWWAVSRELSTQRLWRATLISDGYATHPRGGPSRARQAASFATRSAPARDLGISGDEVISNAGHEADDLLSLFRGRPQPRVLDGFARAERVGKAQRKEVVMARVGSRPMEVVERRQVLLSLDLADEPVRDVRREPPASGNFPVPPGPQDVPVPGDQERPCQVEAMTDAMAVCDPPPEAQSTEPVAGFRQIFDSRRERSTDVAPAIGPDGQNEDLLGGIEMLDDSVADRVAAVVNRGDDRSAATG